MSADGRPRLAIAMGDPTGIGPELVARVFGQAEIFARCRPLAIGAAAVLEQGIAIAGTGGQVRCVRDAADASGGPGDLAVLDLDNVRPDQYRLGERSPVAARAVTEALERAVRLVQEGRLDGVVFAPLNKQALHEAGSPYPDEHHLFASWTGATEFGEMNVLGELWTARVTSHIALAQVATSLSVERVVRATRLTDRTLRRAGYAAPRIAVAALNPHGGEGGLFGLEERDIIEPGVRTAQAEGIGAEGPYPADTIFLRARRGAVDAIVSMYHDQGQIAMKLLGFERGVTVCAGLPVVLATPAHGTAFDIAGQGVADPGALGEAIRVAARLAAGDPGSSL